MKEGYIPKDQRKKILLLSDDIRTSSGVGTMSKEIVLNTAHRFNWVNLGGAVQHPEAGQGFDISPDVDSVTGLHDSDVKVVACNGYGDPNILIVYSHIHISIFKKPINVFRDCFTLSSSMFKGFIYI